MKSLTNKKPLACMLHNSHLVNSLPFIDSEHQHIPKTKIDYYIKQEQQNMKIDQEIYLQNIPLTPTPYLDSNKFQEEVQRVIKQMNQKQQQKNNQKEEGKPPKKTGTILPEVAKKLVQKQMGQAQIAVNDGTLIYENMLYRDVNLQLYKKLGPIVMRELIDSLEKQKGSISSEIEREIKAIQQLNQNRKYKQSEAFEREHTIQDRIKVMIYKKRKVE